MQPLSARAAALVSRLERAPSFRERLLGHVDEDVALLAELGAAPEPAMVPHLLPQLLPLVFGEPRPVSACGAGGRRGAGLRPRRVLGGVTPRSHPPVFFGRTPR